MDKQALLYVVHMCVCVCAHVCLSVWEVIYAQNYLLGCKIHREIKVNKKQ